MIVNDYLIKKALSEQVEEERQSVVEFHLFVAECHDEEDRAETVLVPDQTGNCKDHQTQGDPVVLEMTVINQDQTYKRTVCYNYCLPINEARSFFRTMKVFKF